MAEAPVPVQLALEALKILAAENAALAAESRRKLPGFALRLAQSGEEVTVEKLLASARAQVIDRIAPSKPQQKTYQEIVAQLFVKDAPRNDDPFENGDLERIKEILKVSECDANTCLYYLCIAAQKGHVEVARYIVEEMGGDIHGADGLALQFAAGENRLEFVKYLVEQGAVVDKDALMSAEMGGHPATMEYLLEHASDKDDWWFQSSQKELERVRKACAVWQKATGMDSPGVLHKEDLAFLKRHAFESVRNMLQEEGHSGVQDISLAFYASGLFGTESRILQYLEQWGDAGRQPLYDIVQMMKLPAKKTPEMDLKAWGDAVLKCGPSMAKLVKFADKLPVPEKSDDGKTWSMKKTREKAAQFAYENAAENVALATLCIEHDIEEEKFDEAFELSAKAPAIKNIPDIAIEGNAFDLPGATFHRLAANDVRGLFLGEMTDCCQSIGGAGSACAEHGFTSEDSGFYIVENARGRVVGQTWAWRGKKGELVFDSLETLGNNVNAEQWRKLTEVFAQTLAKNPQDITAFHVGKGGATPRSILRAFNEAASPAKPVGYGDGYRDSHSQVVIWQKKAGMKHG